MYCRGFSRFTYRKDRKIIMYRSRKKVPIMEANSKNTKKINQTKLHYGSVINLYTAYFCQLYLCEGLIVHFLKENICFTFHTKLEFQFFFSFSSWMDHMARSRIFGPVPKFFNF